MDEVELVKKLVSSFDDSIEDIEEILNRQVLSKPLNESIHDETVLRNYIDSNEGDINNSNNKNDLKLSKIKLFNQYAYIIASLYFITLKLNNENKDIINNHPILQELQRVKSYMNRIEDIKKIGVRQDNKDKLNIEATKRIIHQQLQNNSKNNNNVNNLPSTAVSSKHFSNENSSNKHIKFDENEGQNESQNIAEISKKLQKTESGKSKVNTGKITKNKSKSKNKNKTKTKQQ
ncbi:unnamed protein product [[Candida] boidinii]|uniref:Exosome complex protein n=1 Tax=Candida boidinii TaxID=5477 RepID=A0A9W6WEL3_CANBO|nr:hypothetical protein B5S30_g757 [[Candida] boidinii]GME67146.1 unnamed protein product [[Candida] boidinii]GMF98596.1 unnamed protein product [[Candida] boidinii]